MLAQIEKFMKFYLADWENLLMLGVIMVSAITVLVGILKPLLFNKIKWKPLRRSCLAFTNIGLCFGAVAVLFAVEHYDYSTYLHTAIAMSIFSILWYWIYENTCLRDLIATIGKFTLKKAYDVAKKVFDKKDVQELENEIVLAVEEIKEKTKKEIKSSAKKTKVDKELKDL